MNTLILGGIILVIILSGCVQEPYEPASQELTPTTLTNLRNYSIFETWADQHNKTINETKTFFAEVHGLEKEEDIFSHLPPLPADMNAWNEMWNEGDINGIANAPENVYVQPEFYPTFMESGLAPWENAPYSPQAVFGIMSTPADQEVTINQEETALESTLLVGSAWGTTYYQGVGLFYTLEPEAPHTIEITPNQLLAGPTFPRFDREWVHRIAIRGTITPQEGVDTYVLRIYPATPHPDYEQQWYANHTPYLRVDTTYTNPEGLATLTIHVQEE